MRGYGNPQATFAIESTMDMLAAKAGIDPLEFRRINANQPGDVSTQGLRITTCGLAECMESVKTKLEWLKPRKPGEGVGVSSLIHVGGGARVYKSDGCGTIIKMDDFGRIDLFTGATDMGQGSDTVIAQIVAEELGLNIDDIHVIHSDTDICPWDVGSHASRTTFVAGNAALGAARKIKSRILELGAKELNAPLEKLVLRSRHVQHLEDPERKIEIGKLLRKAHFSHGGQMLMAEHFYDPANENMGRDFRGNMSMTYTFGTHGVRVNVDEETGKVRILKYVAVHDVGKAINPMLLEGQVYGGVMMGLGYALTEQVLLEKGENMNPNFRDYKILTAKDMVPIEAPVLETYDTDGPFGAKGIGEPGCVPTAPAVANAIYDAVGVRIKDLPITPERVLAAIREKQGLDLCGREKGIDDAEACVVEE
jgi:xanthine dehydrogenase molybdenum-binding subunit